MLLFSARSKTLFGDKMASRRKPWWIEEATDSKLKIVIPARASISEKTSLTAIMLALMVIVIKFPPLLLILVPFFFVWLGPATRS